MDLELRQPRGAAREGRRGSGQGGREPAAAPGGGDPLAHARRDPDGPADPLRARGAPALGARRPEIEGPLRRARVPLARGGDRSGGGDRAGDRAFPRRAGKPFRSLRASPSAPRSCTRGTGCSWPWPDGERVEIAEESAGEILERWKALDRPGRQIWLADAKPVDTLLARAGRAVAGEVFDVCLVQYVLSPGVGGSEFEPMAFQRLGQKVTADKEAGVVSCALPEGYAIETADRWLAERAATTRGIAGAPRAGAFREARPREDLQGDRAAADSGPRAHGDRGRRHRRPAAEGDVRAHGDGPARARAEDLGGGGRRSSTSTHRSSSARSSSRSSATRS